MTSSMKHTSLLTVVLCLLPVLGAVAQRVAGRWWCTARAAPNAKGGGCLHPTGYWAPLITERLALPDGDAAEEDYASVR